MPGHDVHHSHHRDPDIRPTKAWYCPMCPGVESDEPGDCPKCGMALERNPRVAGPAAAPHDHGESSALARKTIVSALLALPVVFLSMGAMVPGLDPGRWISSVLSGWLEWIFATPVVIWGGGAFFAKG
jgi:Cu+-exporting ATPase